MKRHTQLYSVVLVVAGLHISGCSKTGQETTSKAPAQATVMKAIPNIDPGLAGKGEELYKKNCIFCHQADAIGKPGVAPSLTNKELLSIASNEFLVGTISDGRDGTGMPPFKHLGDENIYAIVAYLRSHATAPSRIDETKTAPMAKGDPAAGKKWFTKICESCHGPDGNGYIAGGTGTAIGMNGFLSKASDGFIRTTIKEGRSNTRMRGFSGPSGLANLTDQEIDDIIAYMRTLTK